MKNVYALLFLFTSVSLWAQKGDHLETLYFRNPQYVLQMDKMMYPGYEIKFQNIQLHEYLNNKKVSTTPMSDISTTREGNEIFGDDFGSTLGFSYGARLDKEYNIKSEYFEVMLMLGSDDIMLTRLLPVKAENHADSLLSNYKKVEVRKRPVYDKKGRPIGTEATAGNVQVFERGYFDVPHNRVINGFVEDDMAYIPTKKPGLQFQLEDEFLRYFTVEKLNMSAKEALANKDLVNVFELGGTDMTLDEFIWQGTDTEYKWLDQQNDFEKAWEYTAVGDLLHLPYTIEFVGVSSGNVENSYLPLVEHLIESRPLREDEAFDADGNVYETTLIGDRRWMKENLRSEHFQDGSEIPNLTTSQWASSNNPGMQIEVRERTNNYRYNGHIIVSEKNVCPYGFWVPDHIDIAELYNSVTPYNDRIKIKRKGIKGYQAKGQSEEKRNPDKRFNSYSYVPVITELLKQDEYYNDNYGMGLDDSNINVLRRQKKSFKIKGLTYNFYGHPNAWGFASKKGVWNNELLQFHDPRQKYGYDNLKQTLKVSTSIRCVNDPFYEASEEYNDY